MKKLLLSILLFSLGANAQVTTFPWTETFETASSTVSQWTKIYESGNKEWTNVQTAYYGYTTGAYQGSYMAEFDITTFNGSTTKYVSPVLNLSTITNPTLEFFYRNKAWGTDQNELKVYYRTSATSPWNLITNFNTSIANWTSSGLLTLPSPTSTYQIALEGVAWYGCSINVDNVVVSSSVLSVLETNPDKLQSRIHPNPVVDELNVISETTLSNISIVDFSGKKIYSENLNSNEAKINVKNLTSGNYMLQLRDKKGNATTKKFIKK